MLINACGLKNRFSKTLSVLYINFCLHSYYQCSMYANDGNAITNETMFIHDYETILMIYSEYRAKKWIITYIPPVLLFIGTFGNIFSFVILRKSMMRVSTYFYLAVLALADLVVLYLGLLRLWTGEITGVDIRNKNNWICKITIFLTYTISDFSVWLIVAVTVERYIAVCHPLKASILCSVQRARMVTVSVFLILIATNSHFLWTVHVSDKSYLNESARCEAVPKHAFLLNQVWPWVDTVLYSFAPYILLFNLNFWIIKQVLSAKKCRTQLQHCTSGRNNHLQKRLPSEGCIKLTIMLLTVSFSFIVTTFPVNIYLILESLWKKESGLRLLARQALISTIAELLMYVNHCINFYLYCATGKKFRNHIEKLLCKFKKYRRSHSGYSMSNHHVTRVSFSTGRSSIRHCGNEIRLLTKKQMTRL